jgi:hypothetical protein
MNGRGILEAKVVGKILETQERKTHHQCGKEGRERRDERRMLKLGHSEPKRDGDYPCRYRGVSITWVCESNG